ncbi:MAG: N(4)-(beta-N-acetylglucosaminyl)-L-asparaginase [Candidatus Marinimicrobia bacterium]|jgi:isoaspartyl peptidase/L-asparaginase-like protein (Ntn-hydrolase superfamily)|nr:N(4)-(beta-N-acetylglucosaminyl)-L-asparaginase [Candidatus Neomarinimicrobiota bacterium]MDP6836670.1 N(4)-(beta-N-acetylglucosaminyl)-L-asparaginase [Candidatus Neomarinimicrobiota bacterium]|tara:strand:- start:17339 stop:18307 length:969 start_codon:yes stop_codon:yes gene_type:complete
MISRRKFIQAVLATSAIPAALVKGEVRRVSRSTGKPAVISTWSFGVEANQAAMKILERRGSALDAVEAGVRVPEGDPEMGGVGYGGLPDEDGHVTLDSCIMDSTGNAGSVAFIQDIKHPISVARKVMERSKHVMLVGDGARRFALSHGFKEENLLTDQAREAWLKWKEGLSDKDNWGPNEDHDTISMLTQDEKGNLAGACTTSGLAFKIHGRIGDSPIIGAGMFCDNDIGAAGATGLGEEVIKTAGSFLVVELMRQGFKPEDACKEALQRITRRYNGNPDFQVAYIALRKDGVTGAAAIKDGFQYALYQSGKNRLYDVKGLT